MQRQTTIFWILASVFVFSLVLNSTVADAQALRRADLPSPHEFFTDVVLTNQDGVQKRLYSDLLKDRTVVVSVLDAHQALNGVETIQKMADLQSLLGDRMGTEVTMITLAVSRMVDTQGTLKSLSETLDVRQDWDLLTGDEKSLQTTLAKFGQELHTSADDAAILLIGNESTGNWKTASGLSTAHEIHAAVTSVLSLSLGELSLNMDE